jgi:hypothetical protein
MQQFISSLGIFLKGAVDRTPSLRARDWNERIVDPASRCLLLPGAYTTSVRTPRGQIVNISPEAGWRYPWFPTVRWKDKAWHVNIRPGFVNGQDPEVAGYGDLIDGPWIRLPAFREVPGEGSLLPKFFERLGVKPQDTSTTVSELGGVQVDITDRTPTIPPRLLAACDVWVSVARATYRGEVTVVDQSGTSGEVVDYAVTYDSTQLDRLGARPRLLVGDKMPEVKAPTIYERLNGEFQDDGEDRILICTIYFLSPENATEFSPNQLWQPFPASNAFWNMGHAARNAIPKAPPDPIRLFTGLAGGWGDLIGNQMLSSINEVSDRVNNAVNTTTNEGRFWTI